MQGRPRPSGLCAGLGGHTPCNQPPSKPRPRHGPSNDPPRACPARPTNQVHGPAVKPCARTGQAHGQPARTAGPRAIPRTRPASYAGKPHGQAHGLPAHDQPSQPDHACKSASAASNCMPDQTSHVSRPGTHMPSTADQTSQVSRPDTHMPSTADQASQVSRPDTHMSSTADQANQVSRPDTHMPAQPTRPARPHMRAARQDQPAHVRSQPGHAGNQPARPMCATNQATQAISQHGQKAAHQLGPYHQSASTASMLPTSSDPTTSQQTACQPARPGAMTGTCHTKPASLPSTQPAQHSPGQQTMQHHQPLQQTHG
ncbi:hypothetical protein I3760_11G063100 [Carya illinoinensis]|nr:hypothetical protein I3760_11G063100 [Carya illinoinensis]